MEKQKYFVYHAASTCYHIILYLFNEKDGKKIIKCNYTPYFYVGPIYNEGVDNYYDDIENEMCVEKEVEMEKFFNNGEEGKKNKYYFCRSRLRKTINCGRGRGRGGKDLNLYDTKTSPLLQFQHELGFPIVGSTVRLLSAAAYININDIIQVKDEIFKQKKCVFFDIETYSTVDKIDNEIFQISLRCCNNNYVTNTVLSLKVNGSEKVYFRKKKIGDILEKYKIINCADEKELLIAFFKHIIDFDPMFIIGYNIYNFDIKEIYERSLVCNIETFYYKNKICRVTSCPFFVESNDGGIDIVFSEKFNANTISFCQTYTYSLEIARAVSIDVYKFINDNYSLDSYKLDSVCRHFLGNDISKYNMSYLQINDNYRKGKHIKTIAWYCLVDSILVDRLFEKLNIFYSIVSIATLSYNTIVSSLRDGISSRCNNIFYIFLSKNFCILNYEENKNKEVSTLKGGHVLTPEVGYYKNVISLDFASLYPSIIMAYNLCPSTFISDESESSKEKQTFIIDGKKYHFLTKDERQGYTPKLISKLIEARKEKKKEMEQCLDGSIEKIIKDKEQLSLKLTANSIYGIFGVVRNGDKNLGFIPVASTITHIGRFSVINAQNYINKLNVGHVIYGDTDSNYVKLKDSFTVEECARAGKYIEKCIKDEKIFPHPMSLEYEKDVHLNFLLIAKKRYLYTSIKSDKKIKSKGTLLSRRNNSLFVKEIYTNCVSFIFFNDNINNNNMSAFISFFVLQIKTRLNDNLPEMYKCTCTTNSLLSRKIDTAQSDLLVRMEKRGEVIPSARIDYIVIGRDASLGKNGRYVYETPEVVKNNNLKIYYKYYIEYLINPIRQLIEVRYKLKMSQKKMSNIISAGLDNKQKTIDFFFSKVNKL